MTTAAPFRRNTILGRIDIAGLEAGFAPLPPDKPEPGVLTRAINWFDRQRQRQRAALAELDSRLLADIRATHAEALRESGLWS